MTVFSDVVPGLEADRLECGAADVLLARVLRQADDGPARVRSPPRRVEPRKTEMYETAGILAPLDLGSKLCDWAVKDCTVLG